MNGAEEIRFGEFILVPGRKLLLRGHEEVRIGQRALDLLVALAQRPGMVLDRDALVAAVWPGRHVDDSNLRAQIAALRKALGESEAEARHVLTVPGRGYSFIAPLRAPAPRPAAVATGNLPTRLQPVVGRDADIALIAESLAQRRFVSLIGAGGIGKTTVAFSVARRLAASYDQPPLLLDLGALTDGSLVAGQLLSALGNGAPGTTGGLPAMLGQAHRLIILDSCEHVVGAAADLAERILAAGPRVRVLATSREPLRAEGEWTYRLPSMESPPPGQALTAREALAFPAVALFMERVQAAGAMPSLTDADAPLVARICRQLDGIPLAIELAATRVPQFGLQALAERLDDRFRLLMQGRRTALPRHQTLRATLDWSYNLLPPEEQRLLRRLAVFHGCFPLEAAVTAATEADEDPMEIIGRVGGLVDKSFLTLQPRQNEMAYRCLDTTRLYLTAKLEEAGEATDATLRHARYYTEVFQQAEALWDKLPVAEARARLTPDLDNLRAAIDWSLGAGCQTCLGIALTIAAVPLWFALGLLDEARRRLETAVTAFRGEVDPDLRQGMRLYAALGTVTVFPATTLESAWVNTLVFAEKLGDIEHQLRALNGLTLGALRRDHREALGHARRFRDIAWAAGQPDDGPVGDRLVGYVLHLQGEQAEARRLTEAMLARYPRRALQPHQSKLNFYDQRILAKSTLARIMWLQGETEQALALSDEVVAEARALEHPFSQIFALGMTAWPLAYLAGDMERAAAARALMQAEFRQTSGWVLWSDIHLALEMIAREETEAGLALLRSLIAGMPPTAFTAQMPMMHAGLVQALLRLGQAEEALTTLDTALADARNSHRLWYEPEYLRMRGEVLLAIGAQDAEQAAAAHFTEALAIAERQTALAWSLRAATSLARLRRRGAAGLADRGLLAGILARFPEGSRTPEISEARMLLTPC
ncbi:ATP-binding protein [Rhodovarius lipocyclicus]|uniref:ATP-binding protein n=1 Tax=Rhodovarius lipocyclicus TaxID=268410 RepID=UPI00135A0CAA|nr:winged helix-turn-helix domain-containing protein [Rhodovarius lipocyclicus]